MGIQLGDIVESKEITIEDLFDKKIAVDAFNWIYQFLSIIRQADGQPLMDSNGRVTSHLSGLFYRNMKLLEAGLKLVYVFDGEPPVFKKEEAERRRDVRSEAAREWKEALRRGDEEEARKQAMRSSTITDEIIGDSKELLEAMGIPVVQAPSEGEALCSLMTRKGEVYAAATQDFDSLIFGCPRLIRNLSITGRKKRGDDYVTINPEIILLRDVLEKLGITQNQLIMLAILVGTDFNAGGVAGYGPKKALEAVKEKKTLKNVMKNVVWEFDVAPEDIYEFFQKPEKSDYKIKFRELDEGSVKKILCNKHDFSEERIDNALEKYRESVGKKQKSLSRWF